MRQIYTCEPCGPSVRIFQPGPKNSTGPQKTRGRVTQSQRAGGPGMIPKTDSALVFIVSDGLLEGHVGARFDTSVQTIK